MNFINYFIFPTKRLLFYLTLFILFFTTLNSFSQPEQNSRWIQTQSPTNSNLNFLTLFSSSTGVVSGKQILVLNNGIWQKMSPQPPSDVSLLYAINTESIFVSSNTEYQESGLFYWNGKHWDRISHPLANSIDAMKFENRQNGIISGLGEIAILRDNKWDFIPPPTNTNFLDLYVENDTIIWALAFNEGLYKLNKNWVKIKNSDHANLIRVFNNKIFVMGSDFVGVVKSDSVKTLAINKNPKQIMSFSLIDEDNIICVGVNGTILNYSHNKFVQIKSSVPANLNSVIMMNKDEGWIAGDNGTILHFTKDDEDVSILHYWKGFEKITFYAYSKVIDDGYGVVAADFNNDGKTDIYTCGLYEKNHLYINNGNLIFIDESDKRGVSGEKNIEGTISELNLGACAGDFDNDGEIDLYVSSLTSKNKLYHNIGKGYFVDYSDIANGVGETTDRTNSVITGDLDNDGDLDIFICNENTTNRMYENNGAGIFREITEKVNLISKYGGTGASFSDIDSDGDLDLYVANWSAKNKLYKNLLKESGILNFIDFTDSANVGGDVFTKSNGVVFADIDNDADMDLYVTNRRTSNKFYLNNGKGIYSDVTKLYFGDDSLKSYGCVISDFDNDGYKDLYLANVGKNSLYKNIEGSKFIDQTDLYEANLNGYSTGVASSDFDNDKYVDLYVANYVGSSSTILKNSPGLEKSVIVNLVGIVDNSSAIGTKIYVYKSGCLDVKSCLLYYSEISGGSGYASMNDFKQIVPCSNNERIDIKVIFPSGNTIIRDYILPGSIITISDFNGYSKRFIIVQKYLTRLLFDPHRLFQFIKWIFVIALLGLSGYRGKRKYEWSLKTTIPVTFSIVMIYYLLQSIFEYDKIFFATILPITSVLVFIIVVQLSYERIKLKQETELEKQKLREKLSRDLHDDLASTLGSVTIYLELLKQALKNNSNDIWKFFNKAESLLVNAKQNITDLIWTIKPKSERITEFAMKLRENFLHLFKEKNILFSVDEINLNDSKFLSPIEKHNIYLIIKECLNNIFKHSEALKVAVVIEQNKRSVIFNIIDNGKGFNSATNQFKGNGLYNIKKRSEEINARLIIKSKIGEGTKIKIILK